MSRPFIGAVAARIADALSALRRSVERAEGPRAEAALARLNALYAAERAARDRR